MRKLIVAIVDTKLDDELLVFCLTSKTEYSDRQSHGLKAGRRWHVRSVADDTGL